MSARSYTPELIEHARQAGLSVPTISDASIREEMILQDRFILATALTDEISRREALVSALKEICDTKPQIVMDGLRKVGDLSAVAYNVHHIARAALALAGGEKS